MIINSLDKLREVIEVEALPSAVMLFLTAVLLNVLLRICGAVVAGMVKSGEAAETVFGEGQQRGDLGNIMALMKAPVWMPGRRMLSRAYARIEAGDYMGAPNLLIHLIQAQWALMFLQIILLASAGWVLFW
ncbi:hypothetical protein CCO03_16870 [Comamonas serinivorans]|uniref:Uncharacterized protein n=1 Tax=Comamonas serinivorans TaxID=1082851 RepID=A0A1Y0ERS3_9BURK|nr:hypothetical protein CCO03_16870 [Comamonas serinivorans]